jgi:hypothetical protein
VWLWGELTGSRERGMYYREEYNSDKYRGGCLSSAVYQFRSYALSCSISRVSVLTT